jgi:hypothetical protein
VVISNKLIKYKNKERRYDLKEMGLW